MSYSETSATAEGAVLLVMLITSRVIRHMFKALQRLHEPAPWHSLAVEDGTRRIGPGVGDRVQRVNPEVIGPMAGGEVIVLYIVLVLFLVPVIAVNPIYPDSPKKNMVKFRGDLASRKHNYDYGKSPNRICFWAQSYLRQRWVGAPALRLLFALDHLISHK